MTIIWKKFGNEVFDDLRTMAAYLGSTTYKKELVKLHLPFPTRKDFESDSTYNPNPFNLKLPNGYAKTIFLIKTVATWGPETVIKLASIFLEMDASTHHSAYKPTKIRKRTIEAIREYFINPTLHHKKNVALICKENQSTYQPYQESDDKESKKIWHTLGVPWFVAQTISQDYKVRKNYGEFNPPASNSSWINRSSVWPTRAADLIANLVSHTVIQETLRRELIESVKTRILKS